MIHNDYDGLYVMHAIEPMLPEDETRGKDQRGTEIYNDTSIHSTHCLVCT
jgi:hypothetical protein